MEIKTIITATSTVILFVVGISSTLLASFVSLALGTFGLITFMIGMIDLELLKGGTKKR